MDLKAKALYEQLKIEVRDLFNMEDGEVIFRDECFDLIFTIYSARIALELDEEEGKSFQEALVNHIKMNLPFSSFLAFNKTRRNKNVT